MHLLVSLTSSNNTVTGSRRIAGAVVISHEGAAKKKLLLWVYFLYLNSLTFTQNDNKLECLYCWLISGCSSKLTAYIRENPHCVACPYILAAKVQAMWPKCTHLMLPEEWHKDSSSTPWQLSNGRVQTPSLTWKAAGIFSCCLPCSKSTFLLRFSK